MTTRHRQPPLRHLAAALGLRPGEGLRVALMVGASFFLGLALVFFYTGANALFLTGFGIDGLPYVYILNAGLSLLFGALHSRLARRLPLARLLHSTHLLLAIVTLLLAIVLQFGAGSVVVFLVMAWFRLLYIFTRLGLMELASTAFDVRQAKRVFALVGLGLMVAFILGGLLTSRVVGAVGTASLIMLAALCLLAYTAVLTRVAQRLRVPPPPDGPTHLPARVVLSDRFVITILALKSLATLLGFVLEYVFYQQAAVSYPDAESLANFLGTFMGVTMLAMVLITAFLAGRFMDRYGVRVALAATPALIGLGALAAAFYSGLAGSGGGFFLIICLMMASSQIGEKALYGPAVAILYQPLPPLLRMAVVVISEGWFQAAALLASGLLLILLGSLPVASVAPLIYVLLALALGFLWLAALAYRQYIGKLQQAVASRFTRGVALGERLDPAALVSQLASSDPGAVLFALDYLGEEVAPPALAALLSHAAPDVRLEALRRIERLRYEPALDGVRRLAEDDAQPSHLRGQALITMLALLPVALEDPAALPGVLQPYALVGLLRYGGALGREQAHAQIGLLAASPLPAQRLMALEAIRQTAGGDWDALLGRLLDDPSTAVRRAAIQATGQHLTPVLRAALLDMLPQTIYRLALARALGAGGDATVADIRTRYGGMPAAAQCAALLICGAVGTSAALAFLLELFATDDLPAAQASALLQALRQAGYRSPSAQPVIARLRREAQAAKTLLRHLPSTQHDLLRRALLLDLASLRQRLFLLLSLIYDPELIKDVEQRISAGGGSPDANALEMLDVTISQECRAIVVPLLEQPPLPPPAPGALDDPAQVERLRHLVAHRQVYSDWSRLCVAYIAARSCPGQPGEGEFQPMFEIVEKIMILRSVGIFSQTPDPVLAEIAAFLGEEEAPAGTTFIKKHSLGNQMYIIVSGRVRVHDGDSTICVLEAGEVVGEMAVLDPAPRAASVTTLVASRFFVLTQDVLYDLMLSRPEVIQSIVRVLIQRIRGPLAQRLETRG